MEVVYLEALIPVSVHAVIAVCRESYDLCP